MKNKIIHLRILYFLVLMFFAADISAQDNLVYSIDWSIAGKLPASPGQKKAIGFAGPVVGVYKDVLIVAGGSNFPDKTPWLGGKKKYYDDVFVYKRKGDKLILQKNRFNLPSNIAYAACSSSPDGIVVAGGENEKGISNKVFLIQWDEKSKKLLVKNLLELPIPLTNASAIANEKIVYIAGGETPNHVSNKFYSLNLDNISAGWKELPSVPKPVSHAVMIIQSNGDKKNIYLLGGRCKQSDGISELYSSVFEFDIAKNQWQQKRSLPYPLSAGTGVAAGSENILLFGGDKGKTFHKTEEFIASINSEKDEAKKKELINQKNELQKNHPGFSNEVLMYNYKTDEWKAIGKILFHTPATTTAVKWGNDVFIPGGEIRAGVRTAQILVGKFHD